MLTALLVLIYITPATLGVYHALLYKRDPRAAMGWIMACIFVPYGGPIAYFLFGINRVRSRARGLKRRLFYVGYEVGQRAAVHSGEGEPGKSGVGWRITGQTLTDGNTVMPLYNGDVAYPQMLKAIGRASERVYLATYILKMDTVGTQFADALQAAVERGVDVRVLVDGFGEMYSWPRPSRTLRKRGIATARFLPPRLLPPSIYLNMRNHRKILIVDDTIAFAGGMNISDDHVETGSQKRDVTDVHFSIRGQTVGELAAVFLGDWSFATRGEEDEVPKQVMKPKGDMRCRIVPDGPNEALDALAVTIQTVISAAEHSVDIMTPYFLPSRELMGAMESAALRGVRVRLVLPEKNNLFYVHWAHQNILAELLRWDIELWYQEPPFCHTKLICIDDDYTLIGSANLDSRSLRLNFELGIEVFSRDLNAELAAYFHRVIATGRQINYDELANRSMPVRLRDSAAALFSPYL
ncbi:MAG: phospholipase D-like domain-containing protein [Woeseia sp.]